MIVISAWATHVDSIIHAARQLSTIIIIIGSHELLYILATLKLSMHARLLIIHIILNPFRMYTQSHIHVYKIFSC